MRILAIDSSGLTASVALVSETAVLAEYSTDYKKTHSQTLLPMAASVMEITDTKAEDLDAVAIAQGPGSFTGLRIGAGTAKGIAMAAGIPLIAVSTLEAMAYTYLGSDAVICPVMDARRQQLYFGLFRSGAAGFERIREDDAMSVPEVTQILNSQGKRVILLGDGLFPAAEYFAEKLDVPYFMAPLFHNRQRAAVLGTLALEYAKKECFTDPDVFAPTYLRPSQAERVRAERMKEEKDSHT